MSETVRVRTNTLRDILECLKPLFPKGSNTIPVHFEYANQLLTITAGVDCMVQGKCVAECDSAVVDFTAIYCDITDFLPGNNYTDLVYSEAFLEIKSDTSTIQFPSAYSTVQQFPTDELDILEMNTDSVCDGLKRLLGLGLSNIYKKDKSVIIANDRALLLYPNVYIMTRVIGMPIQAVLAPDHAKFIILFRPEGVARYGSDMLIFKKNSTKLLVPYKAVVESVSFSDILSNPSEPVRIDTDGYLNDLRSLSKLACKKVTVSLFEDGISTSASADNISIRLPLGKTEQFMRSMELPMQLWLICFKALNSSVAEFLFQGDVLCMRNRTISILLRALS